MRVYFLSERRAAVTANGLFLGTADGFERTAEVDPADKIFFECKPEGYRPVTFVFDEKFLVDPPPQVELYFSDGEVAVYVHGFLREDPSLCVLWQAQAGGIAFTLYAQGRLKLYFRNEEARLIDLPDSFERAKISACGEHFLLESESGFLLFSREGEVLLQAEGSVLERGERWKAEIPYGDSLGHVAVKEFEGAREVSCTVRTRFPPTERTFALALFETVKAGGDPLPYLSPALAGKANSLAEYLGDFCSAVLVGPPEEIGLVYRRRERVFDVRRFRVTLENGKISNISPED